MDEESKDSGQFKLDFLPDKMYKKLQLGII